MRQPSLKADRGRIRAATAVIASVWAITSAAAAGGYQVNPLVSDNQTVLATLGYGAAPTVDPALINPWDFANSGTGPWVVANTGGAGGGPAPGTATVYSGSGDIVSPTVSIPQGSGAPFGPTGDVYAAGAGFKLPGGAAATYIFDNLDGSISGWDGSSASAQTLLPGRGPGGNLAAYTGLEIASSGGQTLLYAANNITGAIDVFNNAMTPVTLAGGFVDPGSNPAGLLPFNLQELDGHMWITYAVGGPPASGQPLGSGFVSEFNNDGTFVRRFATGGQLSSPWGIAIAPSNFGVYSNDVLIGNFNDGGEGYIKAYNQGTGAYLGTLDEKGKPIVLPGLWALQFGGGGQSGPANRLYFTAGIGDENHGLFGSISAVPEPTTWVTLLFGFALAGGGLRRRTKPLSADRRV
jgi:uncharacterized protein (TIGR03118 family)